MEYFIMQMVQNMKDIGQKIKSMVNQYSRTIKVKYKNVNLLMINYYKV